MTFVGAYSPPEIDNLAAWGLSEVTQFIPNPFEWYSGSPSVWIECKPVFLNIFSTSDWSQCGIGILEITYLDRGEVLTKQYGDVNNLQKLLSTSGQFALPNRLFVRYFLSATVLLVGSGADVKGSTTFLLWDE